MTAMLGTVSASLRVYLNFPCVTHASEAAIYPNVGHCCVLGRSECDTVCLSTITCHYVDKIYIYDSFILYKVLNIYMYFV